MADTHSPLNVTLKRKITDQDTDGNASGKFLKSSMQPEK